MSDTVPAAGPATSPEYELGYRDGESNVTADWEYALGEHCALPAGVEVGPMAVARHIGSLQEQLDARRRPPAPSLDAGEGLIRIEVRVPDGVLDAEHRQFGMKVLVSLDQTRMVARSIGLGAALQLQVEDAVSHMFEELGPQLQPAPGFLSS